MDRIPGATIDLTLQASDTELPSELRERIKLVENGEIDFDANGDFEFLLVVTDTDGTEAIRMDAYVRVDRSQGYGDILINGEPIDIE